MEPSEPETQLMAKLSSDAFLELGDKDNAVGSLMRAIQCSLFETPERAIALLTEAIGWFPDDSLKSEDRRAWLLISRGKHLLRLRRFADALKDAEEGVALRSKHVGQDSNLIAGLHLAAIASKSMGNKDAAERFEQRAGQLTEQAGSVHFQLAQEVAELFQAFDSERAADIHKRAAAAHEHEIAAAVQLAITQFDGSLTVPSRLARLADVVTELQAHKADDEALEPARMAMVVQLRAAGAERSAVRWCEAILAGNPLNDFAERSFLQACRALGLHDKAIQHLQAQLRRFGPAPNRLLYLARCLLVAGRASEAVEPLREIRAHPEWPDDARKQADEMLLAVLDIQNISLRPPNSTTRDAPVLREEVEHALQLFAITVEAHVRHSFWRPADGTKQWIEKPERQAQDFLKLFLKAVFQERLDIYEEVAAGAGRIDLVLSFAGGLSVILELKMCGAPYSSTYAFSGSDQILHYMRNLQKSLGYLLIFDARSRDFGKGIDSVTSITNFTVVTTFIDVRPSVKRSVVSEAP
jgi:tetratricopeptide (TPR) repeat protein